MMVSTLEKLTVLSELMGKSWCETLERLIDEKLEQRFEDIDEAISNTFHTTTETGVITK